MSGLMPFGPWEIPVSSYASECGSYERAGKLKDDDVSFELEQKTAAVRGSSGEVYSATMEECAHVRAFGMAACRASA